MDPLEGTQAPPCKRCRRESKQCTIPEPKRKRYNLESAATWTPADRQQAKLSIEAASRPASPVQNSAVPLAPSRLLSHNSVQTGSVPAPRPNKRQRTMPEPTIAESEDSGDYFVMSTAAPWALDFMPVTFCGTIADLSQAYGYQGPNTPSQATSPPSTADGDERLEPETAASPADESVPLPQTVTLADLHTLEHAATKDADAVDSRRWKSPTVRREDSAGSNYGQDLGLDDIFNYIRF